MGCSLGPSGTKYFEEISFFYDAQNTRSYAGAGSTTWSDLSGYSVPAPISNIVYSGIGRTAATFVFNALSSVVSMASNSRRNVTTAWTLDFWINPSGYGQNNKGVVYQHSSGALNGFIVSVDNSTNTAGITLNTYAIAGFSAKCANVVTLNTWQNFTLSFNSGVVTWYKNGASLGTSSITSPIIYTSGSYVGNNPGGTNTFAGLIGIIKLYRNSFTASDVLQNYNSHKGRYGLS